MEPKVTGVGQMIKQRREAIGMSQPRLEELSGVPQRTISRIENTTKEGYLPEPHLLIPIARELGLEIQDLLFAAGYPVEAVVGQETEDPITRALRVFTMAIDETENLEFAAEEKHAIRATIRMAIRDLNKQRGVQ